jgi:hypothetical protein
MSSVTNVQTRSPRSKAHSGSLLAQRSTAQPVWGDVLGRFVAATLRARPVRIYIVSPWMPETDLDRLRALARHADSCRAELTVITRPPVSVGAERALDVVRAAGRHRILVNDQLHAKLYVCQEPDGRGVALICSANFTAGGTRMAEVGVLLRPLAESSLIDDLARVALTSLGASPQPTSRRTA